jgi:EmrB/QacA subfamily drug resistance transporter
MTVSNRTRWWALLALSLAMLTVGLDTTVLTVALPTLAGDLSASTSQLQWITSAYTLVMAAVLLPAGAFGDRFGRKRLLLAALILFGLASLACAYSGSAEALIAARAVLGLAAAVMMPMSMAVVTVLFPDQLERKRALAIWVTSTAIGLPLGPLLGGWLLDNFAWGSIFLINVPLVVLACVAVIAFIPESRGAQGRHLDWLGVALSSTGLAALTFGVIRTGASGWGDDTAWAAIGLGVVALAVFVAWQRRATDPLIDLSLFSSRGFTWGTTFATGANFAMFGVFFAVPQYFQAILGVDALGSGLRLLPLIGGLVLGARVAEQIGRRVGSGIVLGAGFALLTAGLIVGADTAVESGYLFAAIWITIVGAGMGFVLPTSMNAALDELPPERSGAGSALIQALRQAGGTIGVAVLGTVLSSAYRSGLAQLSVPPYSDGVIQAIGGATLTGRPQLIPTVQDAFVHGMSMMLWVCAAICAVGAVLALLRMALRAPVTAGTASAKGQSVHAA